MNPLLTAAALALSVLVPSLASAEAPPIPERRLVLSKNTDFPGGDLRQIFDTSLDACERACLADTACRAFTYNQRANACFPKSGMGERVPFTGALSGLVVETPARLIALSITRKAELDFLRPADFTGALGQVARLGNRYLPGAWELPALSEGARNAEAGKRWEEAIRYAGAAAVVGDGASQWEEYARLLLLGRTSKTRYDYGRRAFSAALNAYLRAEGAPLRATILTTLAEAAEQNGRGRDMIPALRLAQSLQPRDEINAMLDHAIGKYGFRITEHEVQSDSATPRICADFSESLAPSGVDYTPFVKLPESGLSVEAEGRQICISGVTHGKRYAVTFRAGLPAESGETLVKPVTLTLYVRDRTPSVSFPGRAYVLPRTGDPALPVQTVNAKHLELTLYRVSDRNMIRAIQNDYFGRPMGDYALGRFADEVATEVWKGTADVGMEVNRDMTTRLPMAEAVKGQAPGIYALTARVPGQENSDDSSATQWFVISDLGLTSLSGIDGLHVFVRGLGDAQARAGVTVTLLSRANAVLGMARTDETGYASFPAGLARGTGGAAPALITAEAKGDLAFLPLTGPEFDLSDRGVAGNPPAPPIDVFLTTDRGAYRAGETVHVTALSRDAEAKAIEGLPLTARLRRPDGVEYTRAVAQGAGAGGHVWAFPIGGAAPRGVWKLDVLADPNAAPLASQTFLVEDFLPERIDFTLALPEGPIAPDTKPVLDIAARYLFGAPGAGLTLEGEAQISAADGLAAFPGYRFGRYDAPFSAQTASIGGEETDDAGKLSAPIALPVIEEAGQPLQLTVTARLAEGSGRPVERQITRPLSPLQPIIGLKPLFDEAVPENGTAAFEVIAMGRDEKPAAMRVKWTVNRIVTRYQWYRSYGSWNWEPMTTRTRIATGEADLTPAGALKVTAPVTWGEYELRVERIGAPYAASATRFFAGWYVPDTGKDTPDKLDVSLNKPDFAIGDTAELRLVARAAGVAQVTVLSNRMIWRKAIAVPEGASVVPIPVTEAWGAGAYVTATLIQPMDKATGHNPTRALGLTYAKVAPGKRLLSAAIEAPDEAEPRAPLEVAVAVGNTLPGETAHVTLAAVDLGILNLTGFQSPDPESHYFGQRKLGVGIRDLYGRLIDGMNGAMGQVRSGGDAGAQARLQAPPPTEKLVAFFEGPVTVGADGKAHVSFDIPAFNGTVRLMAVAWSATGVGQASRDVLIRDPVVVTASLPRFLSPGDESRLLLEIHHAKGPTGRAGLDITAEGVALGSVPSGVDLTQNGKVRLEIPLKAGATGLARIEIALTTPGGQRLLKPLTLPIESLDPAISRVARFSLGAGKEFRLDRDVFDGLLPGSAKLTLAVGPIAEMNAPGLLEMLDRYPYGCTEQQTSKAMPLLYFQQVAEVMGMGARDDLRKRIAGAITGVLTNQDANGAFGLWRPDSGDLWLDAYVTDFLSRAKAQGFDVPKRAFRNALDNLRNQINYAPDFDSNGGPYAYALMVLAREGAASISDLRYYADVKAAAFDTPIAAAQLGAALASYGDQQRADAMFAQADRLAMAETNGKPRLWRANFGGGMRDSAAVLALATEAGSNVVDKQALIGRISSISGAMTLSTQEAAWALLAAHAMIDRPGGQGITLNGQPVAGPLVRVDEDHLFHPMVLRNTRDRDAVMTVTTFGVPVTPPKAGGDGYQITRSYFTLAGAPADLAAVKTGDRLVTVLKITGFEKGAARLMIADPLPAGFEIDNPHLLRAGEISALTWLKAHDDVAFTQFRQDRFLAQVDRAGDGSFTLAYVVRAVSPGQFHHPAASVEDMYRPAKRAVSASGALTIH